MLKNILDWLMPITCVVCHLPSQEKFCSSCLTELPWLVNPCITCASEMKGNNARSQCGECMINSLPIDYTIILFQYKSPIISLITKLKFQKKLAYAVALGSLLERHLLHVYKNENLPQPDCILPVPLHKKRLRTRGYNQALEIAKTFGNSLQIPIEYKAVKRIKETIPQTLVQANERIENVKNAFYVDPAYKPNHIAIVDDVVTTFSTITELANTLRKNGVKRIDVWCIAKA